MDSSQKYYDYDLFVIGGGSGGLSAAKTAASLGKKVGLADYVIPSNQGTTWGLGGTCVNVGCIPKKLMHYAGKIAAHAREVPLIGFGQSQPIAHNWGVMRQNVQNYIKKLNVDYEKQLDDENVQYYNQYATMEDEHTILLTKGITQDETITADKILIAVGGRPNFQNIPGAQECCISSDDIFSLDQGPGKTLIVGGSYISLECGGFLHSLGYNVTIMVRSVLLRGFDQEMAGKLKDHLIRHKMKFINDSSPINFEKKNGKIVVTYQNVKTNEKFEDIYDTVFLAIGRQASTEKLNLDKIGVKLSKSSKVIVDDYERSFVSNIYAIGDCAEGRPELTPPAVMVWILK